jgi:ribosomal protein L14E/L6E/L27E
MSAASFHRFEDLREKTICIIDRGSNNEEMNKALTEISRYSTIDSKTFPASKVRKFQTIDQKISIKLKIDPHLLLFL